jgi:PAS domain S-box-containing protein
VNATIAEFLLRQVSDAKVLSQRAQLLAALAQLPPRRRQEFAQAVDMVCRTIAAHGGRGTVRFALVQREGHRCLEVSVRDLPSVTASEAGAAGGTADRPAEQVEAAVIQRVGELVDYFESSGWPVAGAVIRLAQTLSPAFRLPTDAEVAQWAEMLQANTELDALSFALRRARSLEKALDTARSAQELRSGLAVRFSDTENLTMLSLVISKTRNAIAIMERDGTIIAVNAAFVQMTGYAAAEAAGSRFDDLLFGPSTDPVTASTYRRARENGQELTQDLLLYRKDGGTFWVESDLIPVHDAAGAVTRWIAIGSDITKRRQTEDALRAAKETAERHNRLKSDFLANLSHEIRTPMNAIIGMTDLTLATELTPEQRSQLSIVRASGTALLALLNDILDLSKIEAGRMELEDIEFRLAEVIAEAIQTLDVKAQEKSVRLTSHVPVDLPAVVRGDPTRLRQILLNLVGNAIKFTEQGDVTVTVIETWRSLDEIMLQFAVRDTGIGIPPEQLDEIFQAFKQGDASTTRQFGGTGLGLTISSELVRMMKGRIWVHSTVGQGSTFHFTIRLKLGTPPAALPAAESARTAPSAGRDVIPLPAHPAPRQLRVLVADDHDANRSLATTVLRKRGHVCVEALNGQQVLEALEREAFDVVLMDVQMPVMDGYQATAAIRRREEQEGGHVPIIALTAHAMRGDRERCLTSGMDAYLAKPLRPSELVQLVESVPAARSAAAAHGAAPADSSRDLGYDLQAALASLDHDVDLLVAQMGFFLHDGPALVDQIKQAIGAHDARQLQLAAHRLKGLLARYAFDQATQLAQSLETAGKDGRCDDLEALAARLDPLVARLADGIRDFLDRHAASR